MQHNYVLYINEFFKVIDLKYEPLEGVNFLSRILLLTLQTKTFLVVLHEPTLLID